MKSGIKTANQMNLCEYVAIVRIGVTYFEGDCAIPTLPEAAFPWH